MPFLVDDTDIFRSLYLEVKLIPLPPVTESESLCYRLFALIESSIKCKILSIVYFPLWALWSYVSYISNGVFLQLFFRVFEC